MWYVYVIRSLSAPDKWYIGMTDDFDQRIETHNSGGSPHTSKYRPWELETVIGFKTKDRAAAFERYLKSGSGFAFAKKHF